MTSMLAYNVKVLERTSDEIEENVYPGLETNALNIRVSSVHSGEFGITRMPFNLNYIRDGATTWSPAANNFSQEIVIGSPIPRRWHRLELMGRKEANQYVTKVAISYTTDGSTWKMSKVANIFNTNTDSTSVMTLQFPTSLYAKAIKIVPLQWVNSIALRLEAYISDPAYVRINRQPTTIPILVSNLANVFVSSMANAAYFDSQRFKLNFGISRTGAYGWSVLTNDRNQFIQATTIKTYKFTSVVTQGRIDANQYITRFYIQYSTNGLDWTLADNGRIFFGNTDNVTPVTNEFITPFKARMVRLLPIEWLGHISLRYELYAEYCIQ